MKSLFSTVLLVLLFSCNKNKPTDENKNTSNSFYDKAVVFRDSKVSDSAFYYYNLAKDQFLKTHDSLRAAKSLINMAIIQSGKGDCHGSIETSLEANRYLTNEKDSLIRELLASNYNSIGISSSFLYRYKNSIDSYKKAIGLTSVDENKKVFYNNLGDALLSEGKSKQAILCFQKALEVSDSISYARALHNLARAEASDDKNFDPLPLYYKALKIRQNQNDIAGQNSSFAELSSYYSSTDKKKALVFAEKMLKTADELDSPDDKLQALRKIINLNQNQISKYFDQYQNLNDSVQRSRNDAKDEFAYIRFGVEKEKTENLKLKTDRVQRENHIFRQYFLVGILILVLIIIFIWFQKRHKIQIQKNELKLKDSELKISKKVHDVVANGIYHVMTEVENQQEINRESILYKLESVYEKSRNISYETAENRTEEPFSDKISKLLSTFQSENRKIFIIGNESNIWDGLSELKKENIYHILQELMVNMKKHSEADLVVTRFERTDNQININYSDNGIGIKNEKIHKNGLRNTVNRTKVLGGRINFETETETGLKIELSLPVF